MHNLHQISLWNRDHEDGSYSAEANGWKLAVVYTPEPPKGGPFGFSWVATSPDGKETKSTELLEEPEVAMLQAETAAGLHAPAAPTAEGAAD